MTPSFPTRRSSDFEIDQEPVERRGQEGQRLLIAEFDTLDLGAVAIDRNFGLVIRDPVETAAEGIVGIAVELAVDDEVLDDRSEEHTSEIKSLMRSSYAVFCLKTKTKR